MHLPDQIGYEMAALRILEPSGRTPRALYVDGSRSRFPLGVGVEKRLPGRPLRYESDLAEAAAVLADIHALPEPLGTPFVTPAHPLASVVEESRAGVCRLRGVAPGGPAGQGCRRPSLRGRPRHSHPATLTAPPPSGATS